MFLVVLVDEFLDESCREECVILVWFRWNGKVGDYYFGFIEV